MFNVQSMTEISDAIDEYGSLVVYIGADWCQPCKRLKPHVAAVQKELPDLQWAYVDVDKVDPDVNHHFKVQSVPKIYLMTKNSIKEIEGRTSIALIKELD